MIFSGEIPPSMQGPQAMLPPPQVPMTLAPTTVTTTLVPPPPTTTAVPITAAIPPPQHQQPSPPPPVPQQQLTPVTTTAIYSYQPTLTYQHCSQTLPALQAPPPTTYYYPQTTYHTMPPQQAPAPPPPLQPGYHTGYHDFVPMPPVTVPPPVTTTTLMSIVPPPNMIVQSGHSGMLQQQQLQHGVMSPSLTSGFSGSGDCKSTETSSILSAASYSSVGAVAPVISDQGYVQRRSFGLDSMEGHDGYYYNNNNNHQNYYSGHVATTTPYNFSGMNHNNHSSHISSSSSNIKKANATGSNLMKKSAASSTGRPTQCDVCQMTFPSAAVLENHVKGSRHARKLKSQQVFRQLKESGTHFRQGEEAGGELRCEVCQVSVNSSQQLQAHLIGKKCARKFCSRDLLT